jgi:transcriptional regulator with GAF, ATPase, and Fis domain
VSALEDFHDAERRVAERLQELEPLVAEYRELEQIAERLGLARSSAERDANGKLTAPRDPAAGSGRRASRPSGARRSGASRQAAAAGERDRQLLELVNRSPGITVAQAGKELGVDPTGLYRVVRRMEQRGAVRKEGRELRPTGQESTSQA